MEKRGPFENVSRVSQARMQLIVFPLPAELSDSKLRFAGKTDLHSLRMTVPLVSYIRNSLRFWYHASLSNCSQNLEKKIGVTRKIWEKAEFKLLRDLTEKSVNF